MNQDPKFLGCYNSSLNNGLTVLFHQIGLNCDENKILSKCFANCLKKRQIYSVIKVTFKSCLKS